MIDVNGDLVVHRPQHKLINNGGAVIWLPRSCFDSPAPLKTPDVYAQTALQEYPLATKLEFANGDIFRYGKIGATSTSVPVARLVVNANLVPGSAATHGYEGSLDATSPVAVGSTKLVLNDTTDRIQNAYEDAYLACFPSGHYAGYRIAGNLAAVSVDDVTIYLDDPKGLRTALVVNSTGITAAASLFSNMRQGGTVDAGYETCVGACLAPTFTTDYFAWVQRRGRCFLTPTVWFGGAVQERGVAMWHADGTICAPNYDTDHMSPEAGGQIIGYLANRTVSNYDDADVYLTLE